MTDETMEDYKTIKNLSRINARIYELMFLLYDQMAQIKEQLDLLIKSGKNCQAKLKPLICGKITAKTSFQFQWITFAE